MPRKKTKPKGIEEYGKKLLQLRKYFDYTQEKMAALMKITLSSYKKNELGKHLLYRACPGNSRRTFHGPTDRTKWSR